MAAVPPPYAPRDHAQVQPPPHPNTSIPGQPPLEFSESISNCLEWRLTGLKAMYDNTKGESKSKCVKSAVFGDADNLWEVLWYPNSGVSGGEFASLYLSCVPTAQERDQSINSKWVRKGLWWFRFEIKSAIPDDRTGKIITLATKDASDHTFAVKTANWGWQQFVKRDGLFMHPTVQISDSFVIVCTISAQPQPPAGYWLGLGIPPTVAFVGPNTIVSGKNVGSGGGLSAWAGGNGAAGGVAGGVMAGGGVKRIVPRELVSAVGTLLDDPLYSDVEFVIPAATSRKHGMVVDIEHPPAPRRIYATRKLLLRCEYFEAMFNGGFREDDGVVEDDLSDDELDTLSDSDVEEEAEDAIPGATASLHLTTTTSHLSDNANPPQPPSPPASAPHQSEREDENEQANQAEEVTMGESAEQAGGVHADESMETESHEETSSKREVAGNIISPPIVRQSEGEPLKGPKKMKVMVRDAAWSTWWAVLYWIYTDVIYFAPLTSSFQTSSTPAQLHSRNPSTASFPPPPDTRTRREWIAQWCLEHGISPDGAENQPVGPRPVSAKAVYRLADKLDLPALKIRAYQHICSQLTAQNIPAEVFSRFSSTFEDVRRVQVAFFLKHWGEIKKSETMGQIWQQIRVGKHVGFEEVWPLIVSQLEFKQS